MIAEACLGLGSNLGDRAANLQKGVRLLGQIADHLAASSIYETAPVGFREQPRFLNAACRIWTRLGPFELMARLREFETRLGPRRPFPNAPRMLDLDILTYGRLIISSPALTLPHPRMGERAFVLIPLAEVAPGLAHPALGETIEDMLTRLPSRDSVRRVLPRPLVTPSAPAAACWGWRPR